MEFLIYLAYIYPFIAAAVLFFAARNKTAWWEYFLPFLVSTILITGFKLAGEKSQTTDVEYWGAYATKAIYLEDWDEEVQCRHPKYKSEDYECGTSEKRQTCTRQVQDGYEHSYDVDYHPAEWHLEDNTGADHGISQEYFQHLTTYWGNKKFVNLTHSRVHSNDGDRYDTNYTNKRDKLVPIITQHTYENRVIASTSVYNKKKISEETAKKLGLYSYPRPDGNYQMDTVLGDAGDQKSIGEKEINYINAVYGSRYQVRVWILVFNNKPMSIAQEQEAYWKGGNKNELTLCIGVDGNRKIQWAYPFFWKPDEAVDKDTMNMFSIRLRDWVNDQAGQKLNLKKVASKLETDIPKNWRRKKFVEFSYIHVEPPMWAVILTHLFTLGACVGICYWALTNEFDEDGNTSSSSRRSSRYTR